MDKKRAIERLDAIEKEAEELRKIIEKGAKIEYDCRKMYVACVSGNAYLLCGDSCNNSYAWHSFVGRITTQAWTFPRESGQEAIDVIVEEDGGEVHWFTDHKEGMKFFFEKYMELNV